MTDDRHRYGYLFDGAVRGGLPEEEKACEEGWPCGQPPTTIFLSLFLVDADDGDVEHAGAHQQGLAVLPPREPQSSQHGQHHGQVLLFNLLFLFNTAGLATTNNDPF